ncbi:MAG: TraX family protein [Nanobdellota archaeon]
MRNDFLKLIGIVLMVIDHIASAFSASLDPSVYHAMRAMGRMCFPIFAFHLAVGFQHTGNLRRYALRLFIAALIAQPIYWLLWGELNILFTLLLGLGALYLYEKEPITLIPYLLVVFVVDRVLVIDYGVLGILMILMFHVRSIMGNAIIIAIKTIFTWYNVFAILGVYLTFWKPPWRIHLPRYFFYVFYPAHLLVIKVLLELL